MKYIIIVFFLISTNVFAQNAEFNADINTLNEALEDGFEDLRERALAMTWIINGKELSFGSKPVEIKPNRSKLDTILFKKNANSKYDTIICNITKAYKYNLNYSMSSDYFFVENLSEPKQYMKRKKSLVSFEISNKKDNKTYLGILKYAGMVLKKENTEYNLFYTCQSAMDSNSYNVSINEVEICEDYEQSMKILCLFENDKVQVSRADEFKVIKEFFSFRYLPLGVESLKVNLDIETNTLKLKSVR